MISRSIVSLIICTGGTYCPFLHDRHFSAASRFQIGVSRGRRIAWSGRLVSRNDDPSDMTAATIKSYRQGTPSDDIVIRRRTDWNEDEDSVMVVARAHVRPFIEAIERTFKEVQSRSGWTMNEPVREVPADLFIRADIAAARGRALAKG